MFAELGGELVDTRHEDLKDLAEELGLSLEPFSADPQDRDRDLYFFGGKLRNAGDMLSAGAKTGAFVPIAQQIAIDKAALRDEADAFTARARALDAMSLAGLPPAISRQGRAVGHRSHRRRLHHRVRARPG